MGNDRKYIKAIILIITLIYIAIPISVESFPNAASLPSISEKAPDFRLTGSSLLELNRNEWELKDFKGNWLIIYFYPKDFTSGCTLEARGFKNINDQLIKSNTSIIGISADDNSDHKEFCSNEKLEYPLLSDHDGVVSKKYGSWNYPYSSRNTFLVDPSGIIRYRWIGVKPAKHSQEVLEKLTYLQTQS